jgi:hypothetical protein
MTIIKNHFEVFLVTSKKQGNGIIDSKVGLYSRKASSHIKSIQKSKNHQRRIFLDNYYRQRCLV